MEYTAEYKQWIKMNEKAWPIIKDDMPIGSLLFSRQLRMLYVVDGVVGRWGDIVNPSNCDRAFPFLEQDQLQEMLGMPWWDMISAFACFIFTDFRILKRNNKIARRFFNDYSIHFPTMEQLWLAFCQKELYNKVWDNEKEDWVDATTASDK